MKKRPPHFIISAEIDHLIKCINYGTDLFISRLLAEKDGGLVSHPTISLDVYIDKKSGRPLPNMSFFDRSRGTAHGFLFAIDEALGRDLTAEEVAACLDSDYWRDSVASNRELLKRMIRAARTLSA
ncbi:hypothetical protein [Shinella sp.]|uniref:hypothetical protein n=1 Tax=Shinella sp. TaxID=1870904 RepID=UPI0039E2AE63